MPDTSAGGSTPASWSAATSASAAAATAASLSSSITLWALTATDIRRRTGPTGSGCGRPAAPAPRARDAPARPGHPALSPGPARPRGSAPDGGGRQTLAPRDSPRPDPAGNTPAPGPERTAAAPARG